MSLSKNINLSLVLVQPRKTHPFITERLLMGRKESKTNKQLDHFFFSIEVVRGMDYSNASSQQDDSEAWGGSPVNSYGNSGLQMEPASSTSDDFPGGGQVGHFLA